MASSIFNIQQEYKSLINAIIENDGVLEEGQEELLKITEKELYKKSESYCWLIKEKSAEVDIIQNEIDRLTKLKQVRQNLIDRLKQVVLDAMNLCEISKIELPTLKISVRESQAVEVINEATIPEAFKKTKTTTTIDKVYLKERLKDGDEITGAILKTNTNLVIK